MESVKTAALWALVVTSLILTGRLWLGLPRPPVSMGNPLPPAEEIKEQLNTLLGPPRVIVHLGRDRHTAFASGSPSYRQVWPEVRRLMEGAAGAPRYAVTAGEVAGIRRKGLAVEFRFPLALPLWEKEAAPLVAWGMVAVDPEPVAILQEAGGSYFKLPLGGEAAILRGLLSEIAGGRIIPYRELPSRVAGLRLAEGLYVLSRLPTLGLLETEGERVTPDLWARSFYGDLSLVRQVEERDGVMMYTDGQSVMRAYPNGGLEYRMIPVATGGESVPAALAAVESAALFVARHGGFPPGTFVWGVSRSTGQEGIPSAFLVSYSFHYGDFPLVGDRVPVQVVFGSRGVQAYRRAGRMPSSLAPPLQMVITPEAALEKVAAAVGAGRQVVDIFLGFYLPASDQARDPLRPVWAIILGGDRPFFVDAFSGRLFPEP